MSDNWVVQNLINVLETWNQKLAEIWQLITQSPETFKGGGIWKVMVDIHGAVQAIGLALLVLFLLWVSCVPVGAFDVKMNYRTPYLCFNSSTFFSMVLITLIKSSSLLPVGSLSPQSSRCLQGRNGHATLQPIVTTISTGRISDSNFEYCVFSISMP